MSLALGGGGVALLAIAAYRHRSGRQPWELL
jgi:hypothetical protein